MRFAAVGVGVALVIGCHSAEETTHPPVATTTTAEQDALWSMAPRGAIGGIVVSPRALQLIDNAWTYVDAFINNATELRGFAYWMDESLRQATGTPSPSLATLGLSIAGGGAVFVTTNKKVMFVIPVDDRDRFLALVHGTKGDPIDSLDSRTTCRVLQRHYVCVEEGVRFEQVAKGHLAMPPATRGDIEVLGNIPVDARWITLSAAVVLARGGFMIRGEVAGLPATALAALGEASTPRLETDGTTSFALVHLPQHLTDLPVPDEERVLLSALRGPLSFTSTSNKLEAQCPLADPNAIKSILDACEIGPLATLDAHTANGRCTFAIPHAPKVLIDLSLADTTLRATHTLQAVPAKRVELTDLGRELANNPWQDAFWGRGSFMSVDLDAFSKWKAMPASDVDALVAFLRVIPLLNEFGAAVRVDGDALHFVLGVRTAWSNPDDVVAKLLAITPAEVAQGKGPVLAAAAAAPGSPLESDLRAGYSGLLIPAAGVRIVGGLALTLIAKFVSR